MNSTLTKLILLLPVTLFVSCSKEKNRVARDSKSNLQYAKKFEILGDQLRVLEPWPGATRPVTYDIGKDIERIVVTSTTHLPYLEMLGVEQRLVGFPNTSYIYSPQIRSNVEAGEILDIGMDGNLNIELLLSTRPDAVIAFDMGSESATLDKIEESNIPVIYNADYLETSALGRAEWIKFFGELFNKRALADSIFREIRNRYDSLSTLASSVDNKPTVFSGVMYGDIWFLPGGQNWGAKFIGDAGGNYLWASDSSSGWLELSFESVFDKGKEADFWIGTSTMKRRSELESQDSRYVEFDAFARDNVYSYHKRLGPGGGFDFFESGYARPDLVLADYIKILHPDLLPNYQTVYLEKLP